MLEESAIKKIIKLRLTGMSLNMIAKELQVSRASVKYHCIKNNLGGVIAHNPLVDEAYEKFINGFNKRHSKGFIYVSGFVNSESSVLIRCKQCGKEFKRSAQIARKDKKLTCGYCKTLDIERRLQEKEIERKVEQEIRKKNKEQLLVSKQQKREQSLITLCQVCGNTFKGSRLGLKYCSKECKKKHNNRAKELKRRKRIALNGEIDSDISLERLIKKECNVCYICKGECDINDYTITNEGHFVVGSNYPSIEHVIPISKGGKHTWNNIKLAHHYCNTIKSNK
ncbi:HNH endonuclease signature motif containing protein [Bacillus cereus]|nr:HNH endonuclease signature motif containing protein [Bacillus cereus]EEL27590.1 Gp100 [Bacillus cereus Rock1-15]MDF9626478.1 HNH endonuclease signature motif containing protein [Bacillus cereus]